MKKRSIYLMLSGAVALASAFGIAGCSSSDDVVENNPNYNPETGEVNVNFVFNVSTANEPFTRMTAANTQATTDQAFRGINNAYLGVVKLDKDGKAVSTATTPIEKVHSVGTILDAKKLSQSEDNDLPESRRVIQLSLPTEVNTLMFWGKAIKDGTDRDQGKITMKVSDDLSQTSFSMCRIVPETAEATAPHIYQAALLQHQKVMAACLTQIIRSSIPEQNVTFGGESRTIPTLAWSDFVKVEGEAGNYTMKVSNISPVKDGAGNDQAMSALGEKLSMAFVTLNTIHANELRAGAGDAVAYMMKDLMSIINSVCEANPVSLQEVVTQIISNKIKENVELFFDADKDYIWKNPADIQAILKLEGADEVTATCDFNKFPSTFNLPLGSVLLEFVIAPKDASDASKGLQFTYNYRGAVDTYAMGGSTTSTDAFNPMNYVYPAELCYFGNSPIRVTNVAKVENDYPDGSANWEKDESWNTDWTNNARVLSTTRSVAMRDNINYGTAMLETRVKYGADVLEDNNKKLQKLWNDANEENNKITVTENDNHFLLTGVLVGGQEPEVGWNYIAKSATPGFGFMVYDKVKSKLQGNGEVDYIQIPAYSVASGIAPASVPNYTLLWDNWEEKQRGNRQRDVYVALEFKNNSVDFYGENNLIRNGATFYIVGKLDPDKMPDGLKKADNTAYTQAEYEADRSLGITWPSSYSLPPYDTNGNTTKERRVFMQDYKTVATFVIGKESLQHALVAVPNLRSGQISLGLSVDVKWQTGLNFSNIILGE